MRFPNRWTVGDWTFYQVEGHGFSGALKDRPLFGYTVGDQMDDDGLPRLGELYGTLEHAMAAAIAEKYTGPRGAGGTGVGTAADWFMRMLGVGQLQEAGPDGGRALAEVLHTSDGFPPVGPAGFARRIEERLERQGIVLARQAID